MEGPLMGNEQQGFLSYNLTENLKGQDILEEQR